MRRAFPDAMYAFNASFALPRVAQVIATALNSLGVNAADAFGLAATPFTGVRLGLFELAIVTAHLLPWNHSLRSHANGPDGRQYNIYIMPPISSVKAICNNTRYLLLLLKYTKNSKPGIRGRIPL